MEYSKATFEPTVGESFNHGWKTIWKYFLELFLIGLLLFIISIPINALSFLLRDGNLGFGLLIFIVFTVGYGILILGPLEYGMYYAYLKAARGEGLKVSDMFTAFKDNYVNVMLAALLTNIIIGIGIVMLIIPGIFFACKLAFVPYLVIDKKLDAVKAVQTSWQMTEGYAMNIFAMGLLSIFIAIGGLIAFLVGVIIAAMWIYASFASIYYSVDSRQTPEENLQE
jgi:uncharacterized membrane protein